MPHHPPAAHPPHPPASGVPGHTTLITGASSGIGAGLARELSRRGESVGLAARRLGRLQTLEQELAQTAPGARVSIVELDVADADAVGPAFDRVRRDLGGRLDRVVVNAGVGGGGATIGSGGSAANRHIIEVNLLAALTQIEEAMRIFREQGHGHLVVMSSISAVRGLPGALTAYSASKAGLASLAEGVRAGLPRGGTIKVTTLFPGYIVTEMNEHRADQLPHAITVERGSALIARAIERERPTAVVPWWPWKPLSLLTRTLPLSVVARMT